MKPVLYDGEGRAIRFQADDGRVYAPVSSEKFAKWDGSPLRVLPGQTAHVIIEPDKSVFGYAGAPVSEQVADKTAMAIAQQKSLPEKPFTFWKPKWDPPEPPEVIAVKESLDPVQRRRAETMRRLGGGPLVKAQKAAEKRMAREQDEGIRAILDGLRTRPVL
jgi:hypothetical protein